MTCSPQRSLNTCKGVIRCKEFLLCDTQEIIEELRDQGVTDVVNITVKADDGSTRRKTNTVILTFALPNPPQSIQACYIRISVAKYIPNPLRCFKCQKLGHGRSNNAAALLSALSAVNLARTAQQQQNAPTAAAAIWLLPRNVPYGCAKSKCKK